MHAGERKEEGVFAMIGVINFADKTIREVGGVAAAVADGLAADVRRVKEVSAMARALAREVGWPRVMVIFADVLAERIG